MKGVLLSSLAFGGSWSGAVWYWRDTNRMPATGELAAYLIALPLALLLGYWLARKTAAAWSGRQAASPAPAAQASGAGDAAASAMAAAAAAQAQAAAQLRIAAASLRVPHGDSADALAEAMASNKARPDLDKELSDDDGFPVMTARAEGVDEQAMEQEINAWLADSGQAALHARPEFWRALALAAPVMRDLASWAGSHQRLADLASASDMSLAGANARQAAQALNAVPMLQLVAMLPQEWNAPSRDTAARWLRQQLVQAGWPLERIALNARTDHHPGPVLAALQSSSEPCVAVLLACGSHIGEQTMNAWSSADKLFSAARPQGAIPGEGAAGLLLADAAQAVLLAQGAQAAYGEAADADSYPLLAAVAAGARSDHIGQARSGECAVLTQLARQALRPLQAPQSSQPQPGAAPAPQPPADAAAAVLAAPAVPLLIADTGHGSARVMELMAAAGAVQPQLDAAKDILALGNATGQAGCVGFLAALALARHESQARDEPVLCIANEDPYLRCAALIRPGTPA
ncbi:hypothetical protein LJR289_002501 [Pseudoduganella sp. LjRoot289]|uniref:hypothetical protein n=1 Tax=Pseudoduganella sp. LjRoot289 TaxID=3342314 RepID=UPI003ECD3B0E